jgi:hypothetical protein
MPIASPNSIKMERAIDVTNEWTTIYQRVTVPVISDDTAFAEMVNTGGTGLVSMKYLVPDPNNMRINSNVGDALLALRDNMSTVGQLHPVRGKFQDENNTVVIVDGNTRYKLASALGWSHLLVTIESEHGQTDVRGRMSKIDQISANISIAPTVREKAFAIAAAHEQLSSFDPTDKERAIAINALESAVGKGNVALYLKMVQKLLPKVWDALDAKEITSLVAKELANCPPVVQGQVLGKVIGMSAKTATDTIRAALLEHEQKTIVPKAETKAKVAASTEEIATKIASLGANPQESAKKITATTIAVAAAKEKKEKAEKKKSAANKLPANAEVIPITAKVATPAIPTAERGAIIIACLNDAEDALSDVDFTNKKIAEEINNLDLASAKKTLDALNRINEMTKTCQRIVSARVSELEE